MDKAQQAPQPSRWYEQKSVPSGSSSTPFLKSLQRREAMKKAAPEQAPEGHLALLLMIRERGGQVKPDELREEADMSFREFFAAFDELMSAGYAELLEEGPEELVRLTTAGSTIAESLISA